MTSRKPVGERILDQFEDLGPARIYEKKSDELVGRLHVYRNLQTGDLFMKPTRLQKVTRKFKVEFVSASHQNNGGRIIDQFEDLGRARIYEKRTDKFIRRCRIYRNCQTGQLYYQPVQFQKITRKLKVEFIECKRAEGSAAMQCKPDLHAGRTGGGGAE